MMRKRVLAGLAALCLAMPGWFASAAEVSTARAQVAQARPQRGPGAARQGGLRNSADRAKGLAKVQDIQGRPDNGPNVGDDAPDFSLMPLKFYEFGIEASDITKENAGALYQPVQLSAFKGKKPVALIFGSYT